MRSTTSRAARRATIRPRARGEQGGDEAMAGESAGVTEDPDAEAADALFSVAVPDR